MNKIRQGEAPKPPPPPKIRRRIAFYRTQAIGMPLLLMIPFLGMLGLADTSSEIVEAAQSGLRVRVEYPSKLRSRTLRPLNIQVTNETGDMIPLIVARVERRYLDAFENVQFVPEPDEADERDLVFKFERVAPGQSRSIEVEMESLTPWTHAGKVEVGAGDSRGPSVSFRTFVFP